MLRTQRLLQFMNSSARVGFTDDYQVLHLLGKGSSARVFQGFNVLSGQKVVVKMFKRMPEERITKEIEINRRLISGLSSKQSAQFIHLLDSLRDPTSGTHTLIYQFWPGVPLNQLISSIQPSQALKTIYTLAQTLQYIHSLGFVHRDMKPANILMTPSGPKLFDFGLAKEINEQEVLKINNFGTKCYKCPEVVYRMDNFNKSVDIWGLGLIFAELITKKRHLLSYVNDAQMVNLISSFCWLEENDRALIKPEIIKHVRLDKGKSWEYIAKKNEVDPSITSLIKKMIHINPNKRPTIEEILRSPVFSNLE